MLTFLSLVIPWIGRRPCFLPFFGFRLTQRVVSKVGLQNNPSMGVIARHLLVLCGRHSYDEEPSLLLSPSYLLSWLSPNRISHLDLGSLLGGLTGVVLLILSLCCLRRFLKCCCSICSFFSVRSSPPWPDLVLWSFSSPSFFHHYPVLLNVM